MLCHLTGMCNASIPPRLPHPGVCKPVGFPRLLIEQEGGQLSSFIQLFFFFFFCTGSYTLKLPLGSCLVCTLLTSTLSSQDIFYEGEKQGWRPELSALHSGLICSSSFNPNLQTKGMKQLLLNYLTALHVCLRKERQKAPHVLFSSILGHWLQL